MNDTNFERQPLPHYPAPTSAVAVPVIIRPELILDYVGMTAYGEVIYTKPHNCPASPSNNHHEESMQKLDELLAQRKETRQNWDWINVVTWSVVFAISTGVAVMMWKGLMGLFN